MKWTFYFNNGVVYTTEDMVEASAIERNLDEDERMEVTE